jgi:putative IMPACT (imprinted ancient) family translation regulator
LQSYGLPTTSGCCTLFWRHFTWYQRINQCLPHRSGDALNNATIKTGWIERFFELQFTYEKMNEVMLIIKQENLNVVTTRFEESCQLVFSVKKSEAQQVETIFMNLYGVDIKKTENC